MTNRIQKLLIAHLRKHYWPRPVALIPNVFPLSYGYECDLMEITKAALWHEYEIKVSRQDFFNDFKKGSGLHGQDPGRKHRRISEGKGPNYFWYVTPRGLITTEELPSYAGLIECDLSEENSKCSITVPAKRLHRNKIGIDDVINVLQKLSTNHFMRNEVKKC